MASSVPVNGSVNLFLVTKMRAVVHIRWRDCRPGDLTCQHKRPNRLRNTAKSAFIRRMQLAPGDSTSHLRSWTACSFWISYESTDPNILRAGSGIRPQSSSATNAARISNPKVTYLVSCWPPWTVEESDTARFFVKDLGLAMAPKMCPDQSQAFKEVNIVSHLP